MHEIVSTISSKGQVTIPVEIRRHLGIGAADKIAFVVQDEGTVELRPARFTLESVLNSIDALPNESVDLDREIAEAMEEEAHRRVQRMARQ
ncbi:MAG: AbrB/MazE/SpoVT family DNA-binding domain-containing protein [Thermomicrobiales bacterium]